MTKKQQDWQQLPKFISWEYYDGLSRTELEALCSGMSSQIEAIQSQMERAEIIVGRSARAKAVCSARSLHSRLRDILQQASEASTHTHQL